MQNLAGIKTIKIQSRVASLLRSTIHKMENEKWNLELVASVCREGPALGYSSTNLLPHFPLTVD